MIVIATPENDSFKYFPGDHVGIYPINRQDIVDGILKRISTTCPDPDKPFQLQLRKTVQTIEGPSHRWYPHERIPPLTMRIALSRYLDITTPPGQQFLRTLATMAQDEGDQRKIKLLATDSVRYEDWKSHLYPNLLEVLEYFPSVEPTPGFLLTHLTPLQPRFYSISSSPEFHPEHIHLTVAVVIYKTQNNALHYGVCSNYLESVPVGSEIACFRYVQHILRDISDKVYREIVQERGHFYVCGDVSMAEDVNQTLRSIIQEHGHMNPVAVDNVVKRLQEENRYHEDIFGITLKTAEVTHRGRVEAKNRQSTSSS
ncbi:nitric oxide synthase, salivary gland [Trichonephila inaurata madagascariensis]|uniref:nitric-oxide synthase (NADPH) n=1 Tax=Trichonephila inaurata madagascariensis TaxID=2747483 RepID=A0A8X6MKX4_9ARAC|nr:nitric oxide synthase, salivary gland [Trichonephila inaurata madagascariensis]